MPRFYFHTNNPLEGSVQDDEGLEFASIQEAKREAVVYAGELLSDIREKFWDTSDFELTVTDEHGIVLFMMRVVGFQADSIKRFTEA